MGMGRSVQQRANPPGGSGKRGTYQARRLINLWSQFSARDTGLGMRESFSDSRSPSHAFREVRDFRRCTTHDRRAMAEDRVFKVELCQLPDRFPMLLRVHVVPVVHRLEFLFIFL